MTKHLSPNRVIHEKQRHGLHALHASKRDSYGKFMPRHGQRVPESSNEENGNADIEPVAASENFPATGTPDLLRQAHQQEEEFERSERIAAAEHVVPMDDAAEWIESDEDDWLDTTARS